MLENKKNQDQLMQRLERMEKQQVNSDYDENEIRLHHQDITSQMSSINQSLLNEQESAVSQQFVDVDDSSDMTKDINCAIGQGVPAMKRYGPETTISIKDAIIDLYLAIKIRSTEELDRINEGNLNDEKDKLMS